MSDGGERPTGCWFEELEVGRLFRHALTRTVTETDNLLITTLTMNTQALHLDEEYARAHSPSGTRLVNSIFTLGLVVGISVSDTTNGTTLGNLGFEQVNFPAPVSIGDTLRVETEVVAQRESASRPTAGIVAFEHRGYNQAGTLVARVRRSALMRKRPAAG